MTTRIVCLGNELATDDGFGIRVGRVLEELTLPTGVHVEIKRLLGLDLLDAPELTEELVIVDAAKTGAEIGAVSTFDLDQVSAMATTPFCCHGVGLAELLAVLEALRPDAIPKRITVIGAEASVIDQCSTELTEPLQRALPVAVETVLRRVGASPELIEQGVARASEVASWSPAPDEVIG